MPDLAWCEIDLVSVRDLAKRAGVLRDRNDKVIGRNDKVIGRNDDKVIVRNDKVIGRNDQVI